MLGQDQTKSTSTTALISKASKRVARTENGKGSAFDPCLFAGWEKRASQDVSLTTDDGFDEDFWVPNFRASTALSSRNGKATQGHNEEDLNNQPKPYQV